jgi:hypothetical protein
MAAQGYSVHVGVAATAESVTLEPAPGCDVAAKAMYKLAQSKGFKATPPFLNEKACVDDVKAAVRAAFKDMRDGDFLLFTLSGHGEVRGGTGRPREPYNQSFGMYDSWWKDDDIYALLGELKVSARILVVVDACDSGSIITYFVRALVRAFVRICRLTSRWLAIDWLLDHLLPKPDCDQKVTVMKPGTKLSANILLLAAAPVGEEALAGTEKTVPPFTEALLEAVASAKNYLELRNLTCVRATSLGNPEPVLNVDLVTDLAFLDECPFKP